MGCEHVESTALKQHMLCVRYISGRACRKLQSEQCRQHDTCAAAAETRLECTATRRPVNHT